MSGIIVGGKSFKLGRGVIVAVILPVLEQTLGVSTLVSRVKCSLKSNKKGERNGMRSRKDSV